jgi:zinc transporter ZupT
MVCHEIFPETRRKAHKRAATPGLLAGFVVMVLPDTTLA